MPPRPLRPKDDPNAPDGTESGSEQRSGNKRRAVSSACIPCRKRKSKCDGAVPSCSTCTAVYRTECTYDADSDHRRKGALKRDIQSLQQQNDALDVIIASLRSLPETEAISLLHSLRGESSMDEVAASLRTNVRLPHSYAPQTLEADFAQQLSQTPTNSSFDSVAFTHLQSREASFDDLQQGSSSVTPSEGFSTWFRHSQDAEFIEHLLNLYFSWVHPFYQFFSRDLFLHDMGHGRTDFCSPLLVNSILAMACHYSDRPAARTDPSNPASAGDGFFVEARRLLERDERVCLTTVQALGIMAIRECSHGRESNGYAYAGRCLRMALELGLHLSVIGSGLKPPEVEARKITFWGLFNLETACSVSFGRLSLLPRTAADIQKPTVNDRTETYSWRPYIDANLALSPSVEQPARPMLFIDHLSQLNELASDMVNTFYAPQERFTSRRLAAAYAQYQEWYQQLPSVFRLENTTLPHVLVLHMYYYACILQLFRPYIKLDLRGAGLFPRDTCTFCANKISSLMNALRAMYGLRRVTHLVCSLLMSASTIHLLNLPSSDAAANLGQGLQDLEQMSVNHQFAARCIDIIRSLATKWDIALPESAATVSVFRTPALQWPSPRSSAFFAASIPRKGSSESGRQSGSSVSSGPQPDTPFGPPHRQAPSQDIPTFYSDPTTPMEQSQAQHAFWTPFPVQSVPVQATGLSNIMLDFTATPMEGVTGPPVCGPTSHPTSGALMDATTGTMTPISRMSTALADWNWQT
ncbi:hypothetical protein BAUCODRAFT_138682 [Baudoinia panamericana UAMH 10762]|uniref:Zn(2)-C6 fungal-type domain-containing protein n=1 Tax=Baudoinia panamericana (strain UAMH 10762) TaxID=717646 RepID=M2LSC5_BAUPA|nr:uncharacterized protein BAUCODRAFT_138682 [Baudoinia panamericana UAMH 10762]EMC97377.1 hypothetical protein BAUCODRAFT_138682 [Baudoinia panamericana UAMH 10762]